MVTIRTARSADAKEVAALLTEAFSGDPAWSLYYPDPATRPRKLEAHYRHRVQRHPRLTDLAEIDGQLVGALLWEAPRSDSRPAAIWHAVKRATQRIASRLPGGRGIAHTLAVEVYRPTAPHWYLHDIASSPRARGKGVGSALLEHRLGIIDANTVNIASLEATSPGSRRLYERFGFEAVGTATTGTDTESTIMVRRPD